MQALIAPPSPSKHSHSSPFWFNLDHILWFNLINLFQFNLTCIARNWNPLTVQLCFILCLCHSTKLRSQGVLHRLGRSEKLNCGMYFGIYYNMHLLGKENIFIKIYPPFQVMELIYLRWNHISEYISNRNHNLCSNLNMMASGDLINKSKQGELFGIFNNQHSENLAENH